MLTSVPIFNARHLFNPQVNDRTSPDLPKSDQRMPTLSTDCQLANERSDYEVIKYLGNMLQIYRSLGDGHESPIQWC